MGCGVTQSNDGNPKNAIPIQPNRVKIEKTEKSDTSPTKERPVPDTSIANPIEHIASPTASPTAEKKKETEPAARSRTTGSRKKEEIYKITELSHEDSREAKDPREVLLELGYELEEEWEEKENENVARGMVIACRVNILGSATSINS
eukprot:TRINITY_DN9219_c0_g4_i1.p2 TRINITY_DN9219_c0_g4~~TRINITY_DN9219_c0_g4_i1.p2  ORF type:complete len:148 (-),score=38.28 TRINITY_DN9219_c0_g4_i1:397-840(-)